MFKIAAFSWNPVVYWVRVFLYSPLVAHLLLWVSNTFLFRDGPVQECPELVYFLRRVCGWAGRPLVRSSRLVSDFEIYGCSTCRFAGGSSSSVRPSTTNSGLRSRWMAAIGLLGTGVFIAVSLLHHLLRSSLTRSDGFGLRESGLFDPEVDPRHLYGLGVARGAR